MSGELERRFFELRAEGRILQGDAVIYGDRAVFPWGEETIEPGAFAPLGDVILNHQHKRDTPLARTGGGLELIDSPEALRISAELPATASADETLALVKGKILRGLSIEFHARQERQVGDLRIIQRAELVGVAVVDSGQYPRSLVDARSRQFRARSGRTMRVRVPASTKLACQCSGAACKFARFAQEAVEDMMDDVFEKVEKETIAAWGSFENPLASVGRGTLRRSGKDGIDIDVPDSLAGDAVLSAQEDAGIVIRPFLSAAESVGEVQGDVMEYSRARARGFIVSATDQREGWPEPQLIPTPEAVREAPRRRVWL